MTGTGSQAPRVVAGRYRLTGVLGRGGMGVVWRASDELIGRTVAVKEIRAPQDLSDEERELFSERALREARTAGRVNHPAVVAIHDLVPVTADDDAVYIVMELVEAPSLAEILKRERALPEQRVARLGLRALEALNAAHAIGLVHRDVKPSNILVLPGDKAKLVDFGIAHAVDDTRLTRHGVAGTTGYMAPELFQGEASSPATDLWSLGATLYHAIAGSGPFDRASTAATLHAILYDDPPALADYPLIAPLIRGLLTRDRNHRVTSEQAVALLQSLDNAAPPSPTQQNGLNGPGLNQTGDGQTPPPTWEARTTSVNAPSTPPHQNPTGPQNPNDPGTGEATWQSHRTTIRSAPPSAPPQGDSEGSRQVRAAPFALAALALGQLMAVSNGTITGFAFRAIQTDLAVPNAAMEWFGNAYPLAFGSLLLLAGRVGDLFGPRRLFRVGAAVFTLASLLGGLAPNAELLIAARFLQGGSAAVITTSALSLAIRTFPASRRHRVMGVYAAILGGGSALGMFLGGVFMDGSDNLNWHFLFLLDVPVGLVVLLGTKRLAEGERLQDRLGVPGAIAGTLGLVVLINDGLRAGRHDLAALPLVVALVLLAVAARSAHPMLPRGLFRDRTRFGSYVTVLCASSGMACFTFMMTWYLASYGAAAQGYAHLMVAIGVGASTLVGSRFVARSSARAVAGPGLLLAGGGAFWFGAVAVQNDWSPGPHWGPESVAVLLTAIGLGLTLAATIQGAVSDVNEQATGSAAGALNTALQLGDVWGLALVQVLYASFVEGTPNDAEGYNSTSVVALLGSLASFVVALCLSFMVGRIKPQSASGHGTSRDSD